MLTTRAAFVGLLLCVGGVAAQAPVGDAALRRRCAAALAKFGELARKNGVLPRAAMAYREVLAHYDSDHAASRKALGYRRTRTGWRPSRQQLAWSDTANDSGRRKVARAWQTLARQLAGLHRKHGLASLASDPELGKAHLRRALRFDPEDAESHDRLGHGAIDVGGRRLRGTAAQLGFIRSMQALERRASALARAQPEKVTLEGVVPKELQATGLKFVGARSKHFRVFARGTPGQVAGTVRWAERALQFLRFTLGDDAADRLVIESKQRRYWDWQAFVWTEHELRQFVAKHRDGSGDSALQKHLRSIPAKVAAGRFGNVQWFAGERCREVVQALTPAAMHDRMISSCWEIAIGLDVERDPKRPYAPNWPLTEGALHAASWLLKGTAITQRGALPDGTSAGTIVRLPESVQWWVRVMRDQALAGTDMPIRDVARQRSSAFPNAARLKAWSFMTFLLARYPKRWHAFVLAVPGSKVPFPEEVERAATRTLGRSLAAVEEEWRGWASGQSVTAIATGMAPPSLLASPSREQIAGLKRLNEYRKRAGLPPCELDAEASLACAAHARYLALHKEHQQWPEAHEQDPAKSGFSVAGMRCAMRSVIVIDARGVAESIDGWMGTIYHRLPLLAPRLRRVGLALENGMCVLDVGSLLEPPATDAAGRPTAGDWVVWPPDGGKKVPRQFAFYELPNPLGDQPAPNNRDDQAGYPISLTMPEHVHREVTSADVRLYRVKKRGRGLVREGQVELHVHLPGAPLLARNQTLDTVFAIPKRPLAKRGMYQAVVTLRKGDGVEKVEWVFVTDGKGLRRGPK